MARGSSPGHLPTGGRTAQQDFGAKGPVLVPHAWAPAPTVLGQRGLIAYPKDGQPQEEERLTPDAPHEGTAAPFRGSRLPPPLRATSACKSLRRGVGAGLSNPYHPHPPDTGNGPQIPTPPTGSWGRESA